VLPIAVWINPPKLSPAAAAGAGAVEPVGKLERSAELSTTPPRAAQKDEVILCPDRSIRL